MADRDLTPAVTDADREAYTAADSHEASALLSALRNMHCDRPHWIFGPPCERCLSTVHDALAKAIGVIRRQAIARARADADEAGYSRGLREGAASERAECDEAVQSVPTPPEWRDLLGDWRGQAFNAGLIAASDAIRARSEGGKA